MRKKRVTLDFIKMTGAGNDFVLIDNRSSGLNLHWQSVAPVLCNRRYGIGADGILVIESSSKADFRMNYFNADGSYGGMCGNGGRCAALFAMQDLHRKDVSFEALDHVYRSTRNATEVSLEMKQPSGFKSKINLEVLKRQILLSFIDTGAPHAIAFMDHLDQELTDMIHKSGIREIGRAVRRHAVFAPAGTNVDFVEIVDQRTISMRTYERGVEDETLACGTGAVACAVVSSLMRNVKSPVRINTRSGEVLTVYFTKHARTVRDVRLVGPARVVYTGRYVLPKKTEV